MLFRSNYKNYTIVKKGRLKTKYNNTFIKNDLKITLTKPEYEKLETSINYYDENVTNIIGEIELKLNGKVYQVEKIYREEVKKEKLNFFQKLFRKLGFYG